MTIGNQALKEITKLAGKSADRIKLAVALADLDADPSSAPNMETLLQHTQMSVRTLNYLRKLGKRINELGFAEREYVGLGWTKCELILRLSSKEEWPAAKDYGLHHTVGQLQQYLEGGGEGKPKKAILLRLTERQYKLFQQVLLAHGAKPATRGLSGKEAALAKALARVRKTPAKKTAKAPKTA